MIMSNYIFLFVVNKKHNFGKQQVFDNHCDITILSEENSGLFIFHCLLAIVPNEHLLLYYFLYCSLNLQKLQ